MKHKALFAGLTTVDIQYFVEDFPKPNLKLKTDAPKVFSGGPATNAAVIFSYLNDGAFLTSAVGENSFSAFLKTDFRKLKLEFIDLANKCEFSPVLATVVTDKEGDRTIFTHNPQKIKCCIDQLELLEQTNPAIVLTDGFYPEFCINLVKTCKEKAIPVVADCGSWKPQYSELLTYVDFAICSADFFPPGCTTAESVLDYCSKLGAQNIAISRGDKNLLFQTNGKRGEVAVEKVDVVDTLGAGDFLHGAFCYYYLQSGDFIIALEKASELATLSCKFEGTREWLKSKEVTSYIKNNP